MARSAVPSDASQGLQEQRGTRGERVRKERGHAQCHGGHCPDGIDQTGGRRRNAQTIEA